MDNSQCCVTRSTGHTVLVHYNQHRFSFLSVEQHPRLTQLHTLTLLVLHCEFYVDLSRIQGLRITFDNKHIYVIIIYVGENIENYIGS